MGSKYFYFADKVPPSICRFCVCKTYWVRKFLCWRFCLAMRLLWGSGPGEHLPSSNGWWHQSTILLAHVLRLKPVMVKVSIQVPATLLWIVNLTLNLHKDVACVARYSQHNQSFLELTNECLPHQSECSLLLSFVSCYLKYIFSVCARDVEENNIYSAFVIISLEIRVLFLRNILLVLQISSIYIFLQRNA